MLLGLTGGYCAGKNLVAELLVELGWSGIDVDRLGHEALERCRDAVAARFGPAVLAPDGSLDRGALGRIVFSDPAALAAHEAIVHPVMLSILDERIGEEEARAIAAGRKSRILVNAALLYRFPMASRCDAVLEVRAPLCLRLRRAKARDGLGARVALDRIRRQKGFWRLRRASGRPVLFLWNAGGREALERKLERALTHAAAPG